MLATEGGNFRWPLLLSGVLAACLLPGASAYAQGGDPGYRTGEKGRVEIDANDRRIGPSDPVPFTPAGDPDNTGDADKTGDANNTGPVRLARFAFVSGSVTWRASDSDEWSKATINLPIRQGAQIWVTDGGHADLQFDDGSELRLGNGALATLKVLFSDKEGEFTQISLNDGLATLHSRHDDAVYQVDTPFVSVKSKGASQIRFGVDNGSEVSVQRGDATVEGPQGKASLHAGDYLYLADASAPLTVRKAPPTDSWDRWNDDRNRLLEGGSGHVPPNIGLVSGELDSYGTWRTDPTYGSVWCPRGVSSDWRPYYDGRWTWCDPFGWTWVSNEPWGWAPYHYGTWIHGSYGWGWCPGPLHQFWSPAVVSFSVYDGCVAWAPLCPYEVRYPSAFAFGFWGPRWGFSFSIGSCGVYYPFGGYCIGRPWNNHFVNHFAFDRSFRNHGFNDHDFHRGGNSPSFDRFSRTNEFAAANSHFVPFNARHGNGASFARSEAFGGQGRYQALGSANTSFFSRGRLASAPAAGQAPVAGPPRVTPTAISRTPTRSFVSGAQPSQAALQRSLYHAPTPVTGRQGARAGIAGAAAGSASSAAIQSPRSGTQAGASRAGIGAGRLPGQLGQTNGSIGSGQIGGRQPALGISGVRPGNGSISPAEAARSARSSLGIGGRAPYIYDGNAAANRGSRGSGPVSGASGRTPELGSRSASPQGSSGAAPGSYHTNGGSYYGGSSSPRYGGGYYGGSPSSGYGGSYNSGRSRGYDNSVPRSSSGGSYSPGPSGSYNGGSRSNGGSYNGGDRSSGGSYNGGGSSGGGSYNGGGRSGGSSGGGGYGGGGGRSRR